MQIDGALVVYYVSNLVLMWKFKDALKAIENFGMKIKCQLSKANLTKIHALLLMHNEKAPQEAFKKFVEARTMFVEMNLSHGIALCNAAMGYLRYTKVVSSSCLIVI
jgi:hypothetical protein